MSNHELALILTVFFNAVDKNCVDINYVAIFSVKYVHHILSDKQIAAINTVRKYLSLFAYIPLVR
ncbi:MAG: hypothetical protein ACI9ES_000276 [Oceanospirillaceae bacterium]|jgi:hypothetical protein